MLEYCECYLPIQLGFEKTESGQSVACHYHCLTEAWL